MVGLPAYQSTTYETKKRIVLWLAGGLNVMEAWDHQNQPFHLMMVLALRLNAEINKVSLVKSLSSR